MYGLVLEWRCLSRSGSMDGFMDGFMDVRAFS